MTGALSNHLWQSTLFAGAAGLATLAFRRNRASVRYWLWLSASLKFLFPFALLMTLGSQWQWTRAPQKTAMPAVAITIVEISEPFAASPAPPSNGGSRDWGSAAIFGLWVGGFAAIALLRVRAWLRVRAAVRSGVPMERRGGVEVRSAPGLLEPGVVGWRRPVLLLPAGIEQHLTSRQLEAVMAHELCHVQRRDNLFASLHMLVEAIFWFHPLVWWIGARLVQERERACDEGVLGLGNEPHDYAQGILNVCKLYAESPLACVSGVTGSDLKQRIHAILAGRVAGELQAAKKALLAVAATAAVAGPIAIGMLHAPASHAQSATAGVPKWEAVSIKPGCGGLIPGRKSDTKTGGGGGRSPGRLTTCATVEFLIKDAYVVYATGHRNMQARSSMPPIEGAPGWLSSEQYQINAKAEGTPSEDMMRGPMLQALLEDRFRLKLRRAQREGPMYILSAAKGGPKLQPFQEGSCVVVDPKVGQVPGQKNCMYFFKGGKGPNVSLEAQGTTVDDFAKLLTFALGRPLVDQTGIAGRYDFHLEFTVDEATPNLHPMDPPDGAVAASEPAGPSVFTALQSVGLKAEAAKGMRDYLAIEHVERPSGN